MTQPRLLDRNSDEYFQLRVAVQLYSELAPNMTFSIEDIYFDYGQNWKWTTIVARSNDSQFQCLSPVEWSEIINGATNAQIRGILNGNIAEFPDLYKG